MRWCSALMVAVLLGACVPRGDYLIQRSALVPHPTPPLSTGAPMTSNLELSARSSTVVMPISPQETAHANAGLHVARHNLAGNLRMRINDRWDLGLLVESGLAKDAMSIAEDTLPRPSADAVPGGGLALQYAFPLSGPISLGIAADLVLLAIPVHERATCIAQCEDTSPGWEHDGRDLVAKGRLALLPSYRQDRLTVYGGFTMVNHPVVTKRQVLSGREAIDDDQVSSGPAYYLVSAGLDYRAASTLSLFVDGFIPVSRGVASYGPTIGFGLRFMSP